MIELTFLKELTPIKQMRQKCVIFATIAIFQIKGFSFSHMFAMDIMMC